MTIVSWKKYQKNGKIVMQKKNKDPYRYRMRRVKG